MGHNSFIFSGLRCEFAANLAVSANVAVAVPELLVSRILVLDQPGLLVCPSVEARLLLGQLSRLPFLWL